jgi:hypothetical protein
MLPSPAGGALTSFFATYAGLGSPDYFDLTWLFHQSPDPGVIDELIVNRLRSIDRV